MPEELWTEVLLQDILRCSWLGPTSAGFDSLDSGLENVHPDKFPRGAKATVLNEVGPGFLQVMLEAPSQWEGYNFASVGKKLKCQPFQIAILALFRMNNE